MCLDELYNNGYGDKELDAKTRKSMREDTFIGYKVFEGSIIKPLYQFISHNYSRVVVVGKWQITDAFYGAFPLYRHGFHIFNNIEDAKKWRVRSAGTKIWEVEYRKVIAEGHQRFYGDIIVAEEMKVIRMIDNEYRECE